MEGHDEIEAAFQSARAELGIRTGFPTTVLRAAELAAEEPAWSGDAREDLETLPFLTIDPPGSRDLDQALHIAREGGGYRVRYAIADVACFVPRGGEIEREAWLRGLTCYAPDGKQPLYPEVLSQGVASLLPDQARPAVVFDLTVDGAGELVGCRVSRATVRSRRQLTYHDALSHVQSGGATFRGETFSETLLLLREVGELRRERERDRGGVSLPILDQHVQRRSAQRLGYELAYETPNVAEEWNAQISLLAGHAAATRMAEARVGLLRTMPPPREQDVERLRVAARALGFPWPPEQPYPAFIHSLDPGRENLEVLLWQARRLMRGADYVALDGALPEHPRHAALAMLYAHCTAPLRRLADRYVLDLLVKLHAKERPSSDEVATLQALPPIMDQAERRAGRLERRVVDVAEAWELRERVGDRFRALVLDARSDRWEAQLVDLPVRASVEAEAETTPPRIGEEVTVRLVEVEVAAGRTRFQRVESS